MAKGQTNSYEEARKRRLEENKRRFQELGVVMMANSLNDVIKKKNKTTGKNQTKVKTKTTPANPDLVRRSSRLNQVTNSEESGRKISETSYVATKAGRADALRRASSFQKGLLSGNPSFVKSMFHSYVVGTFSLNMPLEIRNQLPKEERVRIVLEDEEGSIYETYYNRGSKYLSCGWRAFSRDHKLAIGDAVVIELIEPTRFKVHIFKVSDDVGEMKVDEPEKS